MAKIRKGFVSNSSSSSFIVIGKKEWEPLPKEVIIGQEGTTEFGWEPRRHSYFEDKLNFAYLQTVSGEKAEWYDMLVQALEDEGVKITGNIISENCDEKDKVYGYIDHQSAACEERNTEIFENMTILKQFLFAPDSFVYTDNDNH
jgi:hypothetical protein